MAKVSTPHDRYFKTMLSNKEIAQDFLEWHLPDFIKSKVDLSTVETKKDSFVDENFKKLETDVLFSVKFDGHDGYIYTLVEAQKKPDKLMPLRLLKYLVAIMEYHFKETENERMPVIYPLILYKSKPKWNYTTNFFELFVEPELAKQILTNDFQLVDIHRIPDEEFDKHFWSGIFESCIKWGATRDVINTLESLEPKLIQVFNSNKGAFVAMLTYLGNVGDTDLEQLIEWGKNLKSEIGDEIMTLAQKLEKKGAEKTVKKTALKMLEENLAIDVISKVTELSTDEIKQLQQQEAKNKEHFQDGKE
jgi:predicted transposase/invertase (TIGR01784 family)